MGIRDVLTGGQDVSSPLISTVKGIGKTRAKALRKKGIAHVCDLAHPAAFLAQQSGYTPNQIRDWQHAAMMDPNITHSQANLAESGQGGS